MPKYYAVKFKKEIPVVNGITLNSAHDNYNFITVADGVVCPYLNEYPHVEITQDEFNCLKFYAEGRDYRSAYSDVEGLLPDPDELAKGKRKTKVYHTKKTKDDTLSLKKKIMTRLVLDEFATRSNQSGKNELLEEIDELKDLDDLFLWREEKLGIHAPYSVLKKKNKLDDNDNRKTPMKYGVQF